MTIISHQLIAKTADMMAVPLLLMLLGASCCQIKNRASAMSLRPSSVTRRVAQHTSDTVPLFALEEHVGFDGMWEYYDVSVIPIEYQQNKEKLEDLFSGNIQNRIAAMDRNGVQYMILSLTGDTQSMKDNTTAAADMMEWNDELASRTAPYPDRLGWFCILPMFDHVAALEQLQACHEKGAAGAMLNGYSTTGLPQGEYNYYDTEHYDEFWSFAEAKEIKIYLHPRGAESRALFESFPELQSSPWGFSLETAEHMLRFMLSGFFDKFPKLEMIIGHNGEMLAYWAWRIDHRLHRQGWLPGVPPEVAENGLHTRLHNVTYYLKNNVYVTTSGMFEDSGFEHVLSVMGPDRVMFSMDLAYESADNATSWFRKATSKMDPEDLYKVAIGNALRLFQKENLTITVTSAPPPADSPPADAIPVASSGPTASQTATSSATTPSTCYWFGATPVFALALVMCASS